MLFCVTLDSLEITNKNVEQDWHKVRSVFSCRGDSLWSYQDTERSVVCVWHFCVHVDTSQRNCEWVCVCVRWWAWFESMTHSHHPPVHYPPLQWVLEWHNLHRCCPLIAPCAGAFITYQCTHFKAILTQWKQHGAHMQVVSTCCGAFMSLVSVAGLPPLF